jgi:NAD(P)-dependent dehydrogenase (short-subunit alcohol dehydrogenase family)
VVVVDICAPVESVPYPLADEADLAATLRQVEETGRKALGVVADTRDRPALDAVVSQALETFGRLDIVIANAGVAPMSMRDHEDAWRDVIDINLTGTQNTFAATIPALVSAGNGGSIVVISSGLGLAAYGTESTGSLGYIASKHGLIGLMRSYANLLAEHNIRVNAVLPSGVSTPMVNNPALAEYISSVAMVGGHRNMLPVELMDPEDIANAVAWLVSNEARYVTGAALAIDAGWLNS